MREGIAADCLTRFLQVRVLDVRSLRVKDMSLFSRPSDCERRSTIRS